MVACVNCSKHDPTNKQLAEQVLIKCEKCKYGEDAYTSRRIREGWEK